MRRGKLQDEEQHGRKAGKEGEGRKQGDKNGRDIKGKIGKEEEGRK